MIEGNLEDISLPGLLTLLAGESTKNYRLRINKGGQHGDIFVCEGHLLVATFGILEGLDALSEFLNWSDGEFVVEKLPSHFKSTIRSNINLNLSEPGCFSDQCAFLYESNVGLNTEIVPSRTFGTAEWQEALHVQPLEKEDYAILGWITDGRTMRQAMREFQFDLKKTIGVLYRLLITRSVEVVRPTAFSEPAPQADDLVARLANRELAKHIQDAPKKMITVEFHATDIGGARGKPRGTADDTASGLKAVSPAADVAVEIKPGAEPVSKDKKAEETKAKADETKPKAEETKPKAEETKPGKEENKSTAPAGKSDNKGISREELARAGAVTGEMQAIEIKNEESVSKVKVAAATKAEPDKAAAKSAPEPQAKSASAKVLNLNDAMSDDAEVKDNFKKQLKKANGPEPVNTPAPAAKSSTVSASKGPGGAKTPTQTQDLPAMEPESPLTRLNESIDEQLDEKEVEPPDASKVLNVVASAASTNAAAKNFDERRTDPLPLVSIDIERLLNSTFLLTDIGTRVLGNANLDDLLKQVLIDVERGKTLLLVLTDSNRSESAVLASYRYCLDRGYIEHSDSVMSLTVDLLLGRMELEQYLLQRRRITGDQLRDMVAIANRQGISLDKLLVAAGYMLPVDMERVRKEKERFCPQ